MISKLKEKQIKQKISQVLTKETETIALQVRTKKKLLKDCIHQMLKKVSLRYTALALERKLDQVEKSKQSLNKYKE